MEFILKLLGSSFLRDITEKISDAYEAKLKADTDEAKLEAEKTITMLEARRDVLIAEQRRKLTSWIRPAIAFPVVVYVNKIILWDTVLKLGVTPNPGEFVNWIVVTVIGAYMLTRPFERK